MCSATGGVDPELQRNGPSQGAGVRSLRPLLGLIREAWRRRDTIILDGACAVGGAAGTGAAVPGVGQLRGNFLPPEGGWGGVTLTVADFLSLVDPGGLPGGAEVCPEPIASAGEKGFAYRLIVRHSLRRKILQLQERRRAWRQPWGG